MNQVDRVAFAVASEVVFAVASKIGPGLARTYLRQQKKQGFSHRDMFSYLSQIIPFKMVSA